MPGTVGRSCWPPSPTSSGRDITKLLGPTKWTYFYLYVVLDVFSRYVVGLLIADAESSAPSALAERLMAESCERQGITPGQLAIHADRGWSPPCPFQLRHRIGSGAVNDLAGSRLRVP